jgi:flagella basal body P-ring formation protein FlgA
MPLGRGLSGKRHVFAHALAGKPADDRQILPGREKRQKYCRPPRIAARSRWFNAKMNKFAWLLLLCLGASVVHAQQEATPIKQAIEDWLRAQTRDLPGQVSFEVGGLDRTNRLAPCQAFEVSRPSGAQTWGRTNVLVRCLGGPGWRIYVPVHVRIKTEYLISARPISQGQVLAEDDIATQLGDLSDLPARTLTDIGLAVGKTAAMTIPAGRPLRSDMLKARMVVRQGQSVKVVSRGAGFEVSNEGRALNNAAEGQVVQVRLGNGQVVSGIANHGGNIEINY